MAWRHHNSFWRSFLSLSRLVANPSLILELWEFFYKGLTRNPDTGNIPASILPSIWRLGWVTTNTKFGTNVSNKLLLNAPKFKSHYFYRKIIPHSLFPRIVGLKHKFEFVRKNIQSLAGNEIKNLSQRLVSTNFFKHLVLKTCQFITHKKFYESSIKTII